MASKSLADHREDVDSAQSQQHNAYPDGATIVVDEGPGDAQPFKFTLRLAMLMVIILSSYFATIVHLTGSGLVAQSIVAVTGGSADSTWLVLVLAMQPLVLGPVCSRAADIWGRKWLVIAGAVAGTVGTIIVSRATSVGMAIVGQSIAGTAQASNPLVHAIMAEIVPRKYRTYAQAGVQGAVAFGSLTALYVAGAMCNSNRTGFRHFFYFVASLYFIAAIGFTFLYRPPSRDFQVLILREKLDKLDVYASLGTIVATLGICIALGWSQNPYNWRNAHILVPFVVGVCGIIGVGLYARFIKKDGIYHHALFKSRNFMVAGTCIFAEGFAFLAFTNFVPFEIAVVYGKGIFRTGLTLSIAWYACVVAAIIAGIFSAKTRTLRPPIVFSLTLTCTYYGAMAGLKLSDYQNLYGYEVFFGAALGATMNTIIVLVQLSAPPELTASVTGLMLAARGAGGTISLAASNAVFHASLSDDLASKIAGAALSHGLPQTSLDGLIAALTSEDTVALKSIPGINGEIIGAAVVAMKQAYLRAFSHVYIMAAAVLGSAAIVSLLILDPKEQFTAVIDAPIFDTAKRTYHYDDNTNKA